MLQYQETIFKLVLIRHLKGMEFERSINAAHFHSTVEEELRGELRKSTRAMHSIEATHTWQKRQQLCENSLICKRTKAFVSIHLLQPQTGGYHDENHI